MIDYNPKRWSSQLFALRGSIAPKIFLRVGALVLWAVVVVILHRNVRHIEIPPTVHGLIGVALGLLLVFRTNASYDRFWEGRKAWGRIVEESPAQAVRGEQDRACGILGVHRGSTTEPWPR